MPRKYTDSNPLKIIEVTPDKINKMSKRVENFPRYGRVKEGDWDQQPKLLADTIIYQSIRQRIEDGLSWDDTELYQALLENNVGFWGRTYQNEFDVRSRLNEIDKLIVNIQSEGYMSQSELLNIDQQKTRTLNNDTAHPYFNEVGVNIGRDGSFLWRRGGLHRLIIAKQSSVIGREFSNSDPGVGLSFR